MSAKTCLSVLLVLLSLGAVCRAQRNSNPCHGRSIDLCLSSLILFTQGSSQTAGTEAGLERQCSYLRDANSCFRNYTRQCTTSSQRQLFNVLFEGGRKMYNSICLKDSPGREAYLEHTPCLQKSSKEQRPCFKDLQVALEKVNDSPGSKRLPLSCCAYRRLRRCTNEIISKECGKESLDFNNKMTAAMTSRLPDIVCAEFRPKSPKCKDLPPAGTAPSDTRSNSVLNRLLAAYVTT